MKVGNCICGITSSIAISTPSILKEDGPFSCVCTYDSHRVIAGGKKGRMRFFDLKSRPLKMSWDAYPPETRMTCVKAKGYRVAVGYATGEVCVLDSRTGCAVTSFKAHSAEVSKILWYNEHLLITGCAVEDIKIWDISKEKGNWNLPPTIHQQLNYTHTHKSKKLYSIALLDSMLVATVGHRIGFGSISEQVKEGHLDTFLKTTGLQNRKGKASLTALGILEDAHLLVVGTAQGKIMTAGRWTY